MHQHGTVGGGGAHLQGWQGVSTFPLLVTGASLAPGCHWNYWECPWQSLTAHSRLLTGWLPSVLLQWVSLTVPVRALVMAIAQCSVPVRGGCPITLCAACGTLLTTSWWFGDPTPLGWAGGHWLPTASWNGLAILSTLNHHALPGWWGLCIASALLLHDWLTATNVLTWHLPLCTGVADTTGEFFHVRGGCWHHFSILLLTWRDRRGVGDPIPTIPLITMD